MKKKYINYLFRIFIIIFFLYILYKLYNKSKEEFQSSDTACSANCGAGSICIKYTNGDIDSCNKLTYTTTNTCNPINSYQSAILYNPTKNYIQIPKGKDGRTNKICINIRSIAFPNIRFRNAQKSENRAKCTLAGEIAVEVIDNSGNITLRGQQDNSGNTIILGDNVNCLRLQPTRTGQCITTLTAFQNGFGGTQLNPSTSTVKDTRANTGICVTWRDPYFR